MKKGLFSVSYAGYWGQAALDTIDVIRKAAELGFEGVLLAAKLPHLDLADTCEERANDIRNALDETGVDLIGLAAYTDFLLPAPGEIPIREMQELYVDRCAWLCARLGGKVVRVFTGYDRGEPPRAVAETIVSRAIESCARRASGHGVLLSVQNHHDLAVDTGEFAVLLDGITSANVRAGYDAWSPHLRGEDLYDGARSMASRMYMTICADYRTYPRYCYESDLVNYRRISPDAVKAVAMGDGEVDYRRFFRGLADGGFDGWVVYEMCSPVAGGGSLENLDRTARRFVTWFDRELCS